MRDMTHPPRLVDRDQSRRSFRQAVRAFERGKLAKAAVLCEATLAEDPTSFDALHLLGVARSRLRQFDEALTAFDRALAVKRDDPDVCNNRGTALVEMERYTEALASYDRALTARPGFAEAHNNRGCVLILMERFDDALSSYAQALLSMPDNPDYMNNMGRAFMLLLRYDEALDCFADAIAQQPGFADAMLNRGRAFEELRAFDEAVAAYGEAMDAGVDMIETLVRRAGAFHAGRRYREALSDYKRALRLSPQRHTILLSRGGTLAHLGLADEALADFDQARALGTDERSVLIARCLAFDTLQRSDDAIETGRRLVAVAPDDADAHNAFGLCLMNAGRFQDAIASYQKALVLRPGFALVEWNLAYLSLLRGRFVEGFRHYESRRRQKGMRWTRLAGPEWRGEPLKGKHILLYTEQGLGDTIQFARYIGVFAEMGATVTLGVFAPLAELMRGVTGRPGITRPGEPVPPNDYHLPLMSAPHYLRHREDDTPTQPYVVADPARVAAWARQLPPAPLRVGIAWQASAAIAGRSVPLVAFKPLSEIPGVRLVSLHKASDDDTLQAKPAELPIHELGPDFDSGTDAFLDTAAVMMSLDLVITVDTAIAHLAGALGRPTWIILKTAPDWRWMLDRTDTPWYPTARLFRREEGRDWTHTLEGVARELAILAQSLAPASRRPVGP